MPASATPGPGPSVGLGALLGGAERVSGYPLLDSIAAPEQIRHFTGTQLEQLAAELTGVRKNALYDRALVLHAAKGG